MIDIIHELMGHLEWADAAVWKAVLECPEAASDKKLHETLRHAHATEHAFLHAWRGEAIDFEESSVYADLPSLLEYARVFHRRLPEFTTSLDEASLAVTMNVPWATYFTKRLGRPAAGTSLGQTMVQASMHSSYHRGQINSRIRELGCEPPPTDYIIWLWVGKPAANWPQSRSQIDSV